MHREPVHARPPMAAAVALLRAAGLPTTDLTDAHMQHFFYCGPRDAPAGLVGLEPYGADALLRSLAVSEERRSGGLGAALLGHAESEARRLGVRSIYLLTTTAESFFTRRGYRSARREEAPAAIRATREFAGICPAGSAFLVKRLRS